ncbi:MAG: glycoside hydrolase family 3 protein [Chloroflexia bacterium]
MNLEQQIGRRIIGSFAGHIPSPDTLASVRRGRVGGVTLYRHLNMHGPAQMRAMTAALQEAARQGGQPCLLIAADQEGGTLIALPGTTPFPGNMALGATRAPELARRMGRAVGLELAAMGVNVNYAPVCDVNVNPRNPVIGVRSFGEDPALVANLGAAVVEGTQSAGVAATAKHFPGHGDTAQDSHHGVPVVPHDLERLSRVELPPFVEAVRAGVKLVMTSHVALPALTGGEIVPATLSRHILDGLLRGQVGFDGPIISDAMDMAGVKQGLSTEQACVRAVCAGVDLLLFGPADQYAHDSVHQALTTAAQDGTIRLTEAARSEERILALKFWLAQQRQPSLDVVGCAEHKTLALEIAAHSITLVRDSAGLLPLGPNLHAGAKVAAVVPRPADLTPADTSSYELPRLASALRQYHSSVDEFIVPLDPSPSEVTSLREQLSGYDLVIVGTINAATQPGQAALVNALLAAGVPLVAVAMRLPYDIHAYPSAPTYVCTYSIQPPSMEALALALFGRIPLLGRLPVSVPGFDS